MKTLASLLAALLMLSPTVVTAQPYVKATAAWLDAGGEQTDSFVMPSVGYRFGRLSVEASYLSTELSSSSVVVLPANQNSTTRADNELSGAKVSLAYAVPFGDRAEGFAVVSAYRLKSEMREVDTLTTFGPSGPISSVTTGQRSSSDSGTTYSLGAGLSFAVMKSLALSGSVEFGRGKDALNLDDFVLFNISAEYRF